MISKNTLILVEDVSVTFAGLCVIILAVVYSNYWLLLLLLGITHKYKAGEEE